LEAAAMATTKQRQRVRKAIMVEKAIKMRLLLQKGQQTVWLALL
jgi:hypothetical protein